jgi:cell division protein FtsN
MAPLVASCSTTPKTKKNPSNLPLFLLSFYPLKLKLAHPLFPKLLSIFLHMKKSNLIILLCLILTSCSQPFWQKAWQKDGQPKIRIVDLQGKSRPIVTRTPELNAQALASQGKITPFENRPVQQGEIKSYQPPIKNYQDQNISNAKATSAFPAGQVTEEIFGVNKKEPVQDVEFDLNESAEKKKYARSGKKEVSSGQKFFVQVGSFSSRSSADSILKKMKKFHSGKIETIEGEKTIYRALLGPFSDKNKAKEVVKKITDSGRDAIITKGR